jgi:NitT/TauT family transport system ATP-binding protein
MDFPGADVQHAASAAALSVEAVTLRYRTPDRIVTATHRVSFSVRRSERYVILGPSGCGKSTILKAIAGFVEPVEGRILVDGAAVTRPAPDRIVVFQEFDQLLPWKTVRQNIEFALTAGARMPRRQAEARAAQSIARVRLDAFADVFPHTLSGGMKQRAAIARAMAMEPRILLMDEPFAALDALTRAQMQDELLQLWEETRFTVVFVTHSIAEAIKIGTRILLLSAHPGRVRDEISSSGHDAVGADGRPLSARIREILFDGRMMDADV